MMQPILANAGLPMLFVQLPLLIMALPVVVAAEALFCRRWLTGSWGQAWKAAAIANALSTIVGFPLTWIGLVLVDLVCGATGFAELSEPWFSIYSVTVQAPWLLPLEDRFYWMVPTACLVLLVPAFFVTIPIERRVYKRFFKESSQASKVGRATWQMHFVTYGLLVICGLALLWVSVVQHNSKQVVSEGNEIGCVENAPDRTIPGGGRHE